MKPKLYIRADGNSQIGLGHLVRCMALANMLNDAFIITFVSQEIPDAISNEIAKSGLNIVIIKDEAAFFNLIGNGSLVVIDGYHFDSAYQQKIKDTDATLICIDDLHDKPMYADLIINHSPGIAETDYDALPGTRYALGLKYALLRPSFLKQAQRDVKVKSVKTLLICFGGADCKNLTELSAKVALGFESIEEIFIITGASNQNIKSIDALADQNAKIVHYHAIDEHKMQLVMAQADLMIVPASGILLEALTFGCPVVSGIYVDNQKFIYQEYKKLNAFYDAGSFTEQTIEKALNEAITTNTTTTRLVDGLSGKRILSKFLDLTLRVRTVEANDALLLFNWTNDKEVRLNSLITQPVAWDDHLSWFQSKIISDTTHLYILECAGQPVGQIRYDFRDHYWLLNYSIDNNWRGKGLGKKIVELTLPLFPKNSTIKAQVKEGNIASVKVFENLNFRKLSHTDLDSEKLFNFEIIL